MLASEVINAYEAFCPQEFSMEGDSRGLQIGTLDKDIQSSYPHVHGLSSLSKS